MLDDARNEGDPVADKLIARLAKRADLEGVDQALSRLADARDEVPRTLPLSLRRFLANEGLPAWADRARILRAQRWIARHPIATTVALFCSALPMAFTAEKGVAVLYATGKLERDVDRRVNETGRFVFDVLMPGGFESGRAVRSTQKVRLMHAAVRARARRARPRCREVPINQEELLGTLTCFSVVVLDAFERMGIRVDPSDAEDYLHLWLVVGSMLGIRRERLPTNRAEAARVGRLIRARHAGASVEGRALVSVLLDGIERHLPARGLRVLGPGLMRFFLDEDAAAHLALPAGLSARDLAPMLTRLAGPAGTLVNSAGRAFLESLMHAKLAGAPASFHRPLSALAAPRSEPRCPFRGGSSS